jgi:hypothetical protein
MQAVQSLLAMDLGGAASRPRVVGGLSMGGVAGDGGQLGCRLAGNGEHPRRPRAAQSGGGSPHAGGGRRAKERINKC